MKSPFSAEPLIRDFQAKLNAAVENKPGERKVAKARVAMKQVSQGFLCFGDSRGTAVLM